MIHEELREWLSQKRGPVEEKGETLFFTKTLAERRIFFARRRAQLQVQLRPDREKKELMVKVTLQEGRFGLPGETGWGSGSERYRVGRKREGNLPERLALLSSRFAFTFDYTAFQQELERITQNYGFTVRYQV